ncbi:MAG: LLM class flavin-dependent oxidoreductase [Nocardioides sp.]|uniref:LLM class flavin-dependent oxidoreductase n=1 Tax=Nocardioides sp. TaxID=35761 RepID=UPI0039E4900C
MALVPGCGFAVNNFFPRESKEEIDRVMELPALVEERGFDSVWLGDHVLFHMPIIDATVLLGAFAATTRTVTLGTSIYLLGLRQPGIAAKFFTSLNAVVDGRLALGVGAGGEYPPEFEFAGVPHERRGALLDEALDVLLTQWRAEHGGPRPEPRGSTPPTLLVGGRSNPARRRIIRLGAGWLGAWVSPQRIAQEVTTLAEMAGQPVPVALNIYLRTGDDSDEAHRKASDFLGSFYNMPSEPLMRYSVAGTAEECLEQLLEYADAGVEHFVLRPAAWDQHDQLDRWAEVIRPALQRRVRGEDR